jgi:CRP/FNR family transcriptional regulator, cyclic AMP receptor protein
MRGLQLVDMLLAMSDPKTKALKEVPLFSRCSQKELEFVASRTDEVAAPKGRQLTVQGKSGDTFYVLLDGEAEVTIDGKHRRTLKAGDFFGEISMWDRGPATATVVTASPVRLMVMSHSQFRDAVRANDALLTQVMMAMGERLRADSLARGAANS